MEIATEMNIVFIFQLMPMNWISSSSGIEGLAFPKIWSLPQVEMFPFHSFVGRFTEMFPSAPAECNGMSSGSIKQPLTQIVSPVSPFCHFCQQFPSNNFVIRPFWDLNIGTLAQMNGYALRSSNVPMISIFLRKKAHWLFYPPPHRLDLWANRT